MASSDDLGDPSDDDADDSEFVFGSDVDPDIDSETATDSDSEDTGGATTRSDPLTNESSSEADDDGNDRTSDVEAEGTSSPTNVDSETVDSDDTGSDESSEAPFGPDGSLGSESTSETSTGDPSSSEEDRIADLFDGDSRSDSESIFDTSNPDTDQSSSREESGSAFDESPSDTDGSESGTENSQPLGDEPQDEHESASTNGTENSGDPADEYDTPLGELGERVREKTQSANETFSEDVGEPLEMAIDEEENTDSKHEKDDSETEEEQLGDNEVRFNGDVIDLEEADSLTKLKAEEGETRYIRIIPVRAELEPQTVIRELYGLHSKGKTGNGFLSRLMGNTGIDAFEFLIHKPRETQRFNFYMGVHPDDALQAIDSVVRSQYPGDYQFEEATVDLGEHFDDGGHVTAQDGQTTTTEEARDPHTTLKDEIPYMVRWDGVESKRKDWMTLLSEFGEEKADRSSLSALLETAVKTDAEWVFQVVFRPRADFSWKAERMKRNLKMGVHTLPGAAIQQIVDQLVGVHREEERQRHRGDVSSQVGGTVHDSQTDGTRRKTSRMGQIDLKQPDTCFDLTVRCACGDEKVAQDAVGAYNHLNGSFYGIDGNFLGRDEAEFKRLLKRKKTSPTGAERLWKRKPILVVNPDELANFTTVPGIDALPKASRGASGGSPAAHSPLTSPDEEVFKTFTDGMCIGEAVTVVDEGDREEITPDTTTGIGEWKNHLERHEAIHLSANDLTHHYLRSGQTGQGKTVATINDILSSQMRHTGPTILIDPKGDGMCEEYIRSHHAIFEQTDSVEFFKVPGTNNEVPGMPFFDIRPLLELTNRPRETAIQDTIDHYMEILTYVLGEDTLKQAFVANEILTALIKALFDESRIPKYDDLEDLATSAREHILQHGFESLVDHIVEDVLDTDYTEAVEPTDPEEVEKMVRLYVRDLIADGFPPGIELTMVRNGFTEFVHKETGRSIAEMAPEDEHPVYPKRPDRYVHPRLGRNIDSNSGRDGGFPRNLAGKIDTEQAVTLAEFETHLQECLTEPALREQAERMNVSNEFGELRYKEVPVDEAEDGHGTAGDTTGMSNGAGPKDDDDDIETKTIEVTPNIGSILLDDLIMPGGNAFAISDLMTVALDYQQNGVIPTVSSKETEAVLRRQFQKDDRQFANTTDAVLNRIDKLQERDFIWRTMDYVADWDDRKGWYADHESMLDLREVLFSSKVYLFDTGILRTESSRIFSVLLLSYLWTGVKSLATPDDDDYIINVLLEEAAPIASSEIVATELLPQGRSFDLSMGFVMQYPEQVLEARDDVDRRAYNEILNNISTLIIGSINTDEKLTESLFHEGLEDRELRDRISALPQGRFVAQLPPTAFGEKQPEVLTLDPLPLPPGHSENTARSYGGVNTISPLEISQATSTDYCIDDSDTAGRIHATLLGPEMGKGLGDVGGGGEGGGGSTASKHVPEGKKTKWGTLSRGQKRFIKRVIDYWNDNLELAGVQRGDPMDIDAFRDDLTVDIEEMLLSEGGDWLRKRDIDIGSDTYTYYWPSDEAMGAYHPVRWQEGQGDPRESVRHKVTVACLDRLYQDLGYTVWTYVSPDSAHVDDPGEQDRYDLVAKAPDRDDSKNDLVIEVETSRRDQDNNRLRKEDVLDDYEKMDAHPFKGMWVMENRGDIRELFQLLRDEGIVDDDELPPLSLNDTRQWSKRLNNPGLSKVSTIPKVMAAVLGPD